MQALFVTLSQSPFSPFCSLFARRRRLLSVSLSHTLFVSIRPPTAHTYININIHTRKGREHRKLQSIAMHQMARICFCLFFFVLFSSSLARVVLVHGRRAPHPERRRRGERETHTHTQPKRRKEEKNERAILIEWDIFFRFIQLAVAIRENQWQTGANKKRKSIESRNTKERRGEGREKVRERERQSKRERKRTQQAKTIPSYRTGFPLEKRATDELIIYSFSSSSSFSPSSFFPPSLFSVSKLVCRLHI